MALAPGLEEEEPVRVPLRVPLLQCVGEAHPEGVGVGERECVGEPVREREGVSVRDPEGEREVRGEGGEEGEEVPEGVPQELPLPPSSVREGGAEFVGEGVGVREGEVETVPHVLTVRLGDPEEDRDTEALGEMERERVRELV